MKNNHTICTGLFVLVVFWGCRFSDAAAQRKKNQQPAVGKPPAGETYRERLRSEARIDFVKMVDFYLRNGKLVYGKLVSEDKNKITLEQLDGSSVIVSTYSKREIDTRSVNITTTPKYKHYIQLAEYFTGRTWDFKDDPDDFIQALRCYEKAKLSVMGTERQNSEIEQINNKIEQLQADRKVWLREAQSRIELKKLEFEATIESRIESLEEKVNSNSKQLEESLKRLDDIATDMEDNFRKLRKDISDINKDIGSQRSMLEARIDANRKLIDSISRRRYYYPYRWRSLPNSNN